MVKGIETHPSRYLHQNLNYTLREIQNVIKYTSIKLDNPDIYNCMFIE